MPIELGARPPPRSMTRVVVSGRRCSRVPVRSLVFLLSSKGAIPSCCWFSQTINAVLREPVSVGNLYWENPIRRVTCIEQVN